MNRPNILILLSDQLRRQALGCYGDPDARTPNMDGLARDGVRFTAANATYPVCVPFRFTLMTGEYAHSRLAPAIEWSMSPAERTLADEFNERDYETVYIGKWHLDGGHGRMGSAKQCGMTPVRRAQQGRWQNGSVLICATIRSIPIISRTRIQCHARSRATRPTVSTISVWITSLRGSLAWCAYPALQIYRQGRQVRR